jgi:hypothetical protein
MGVLAVQSRSAKAAVLAAILLPTVGKIAHAGGCEVPLAAMNKLWQTPSHQYMTETAGYLKGKSRTSEIITTRTDRYLLVNGSWHHSAVGKEEVAQMIETNETNARKDECKFVRDEAVDGESASLYTTKHVTEDDSSSSQIWISRKTGLPLKLETDMDVGGGANGKSHTTLRVNYTNVTAPAGVK